MGNNKKSKNINKNKNIKQTKQKSNDITLVVSPFLNIIKQENKSDYLNSYKRDLIDYALINNDIEFFNLIKNDLIFETPHYLKPNIIKNIILQNNKDIWNFIYKNPNFVAFENDTPYELCIKIAINTRSYVSANFLIDLAIEKNISLTPNLLTVPVETYTPPKHSSSKKNVNSKQSDDILVNNLQILKRLVNDAKLDIEEVSKADVFSIFAYQALTGFPLNELENLGFKKPLDWDEHRELKKDILKKIHGKNLAYTLEERIKQCLLDDAKLDCYNFLALSCKILYYKNFNINEDINADSKIMPISNDLQAEINNAYALCIKLLNNIKKGVTVSKNSSQPNIIDALNDSLPALLAKIQIFFAIFKTNASSQVYKLLVEIFNTNIDVRSIASLINLYSENYKYHTLKLNTKDALDLAIKPYQLISEHHEKLEKCYNDLHLLSEPIRFNYSQALYIADFAQCILYNEAIKADDRETSQAPSESNLRPLREFKIYSIGEKLDKDQLSLLDFLKFYYRHGQFDYVKYSNSALINLTQGKLQNPLQDYIEFGHEITSYLMSNSPENTEKIVKILQNNKFLNDVDDEIFQYLLFIFYAKQNDYVNVTKTFYKFVLNLEIYPDHLLKENAIWAILLGLMADIYVLIPENIDQGIYNVPKSLYNFMQSVKDLTLSKKVFTALERVFNNNEPDWKNYQPNIEIIKPIIKQAPLISEENSAKAEKAEIIAEKSITEIIAIYEDDSNKLSEKEKHTYFQALKTRLIDKAFDIKTDNNNKIVHTEYWKIGDKLYDSNYSNEVVKLDKFFNFRHHTDDVYATISPSVINKLDKKQIEVFEQALINKVKFIKNNKHQLYELWIGGDTRLVADKVYINQDGSKLIVFEKIHGHQGVKDQITKLSSTIQTIDVAEETKNYLNQKFENQNCNNSEIAPAFTEPDIDIAGKDEELGDL